MMSFIQFRQVLRESLFFSMSGSRGQVDIFKNPVAREWMNIVSPKHMRDDDDDDFETGSWTNQTYSGAPRAIQDTRAILTPDALYVWPFDLAQHRNVMYALEKKGVNRDDMIPVIVRVRTADRHCSVEIAAGAKMIMSVPPPSNAQLYAMARTHPGFKGAVLEPDIQKTTHFARPMQRSA